jgi:hypothetical protein
VIPLFFLNISTHWLSLMSNGGGNNGIETQNLGWAPEVDAVKLAIRSGFPQFKNIYG